MAKFDCVSFRITVYTLSAFEIRRLVSHGGCHNDGRKALEENQLQMKFHGRMVIIRATGGGLVLQGFSFCRCSKRSCSV